MNKLLIIFLALFVITAHAQVDTDGDGVIDTMDNCIEDENPDQLDGDNDGFGNACDGDYNNDTWTTVSDFSIFLAAFVGENNPATDCDGNGVTTVIDFPCFLGNFLSGEPGPSGVNSIHKILFPNGACQTNRLEVHIADGVFHDPRYIDSDTCLRWFKNQAIESMVVRCVDESGVQDPSDWVSVSPVLVQDTGQCDL